jgi:hypothetical protein
MNRPLAVGAVAVVITAALAVVVVARAQPRILPDPSEVGPMAVAAQTQEPPTGFTGACLLDTMTYQPALPLICYAPTGTVQYGKGFTNVTFPAKKVSHSYSMAPASYDSYEVLVSCYPHNADGSCPLQSFAVSRSCCDYGTPLVSLDGQTASGLAGFL